jgi:hypothetical protein
MSWEQVRADAPVACGACGWGGTARRAQLELPDETVAELYCPQCHDRIALIENVIEPLDIRRRAAQGDPWAGAFLKNDAERAQSQLRSPDALPALDGDGPLDFVWDHEGGDESPTLVIRLKDGAAIWKERASFGQRRRFEELKSFLQQRYGARFRSLEINFDNHHCSVWYYGD